MYNPCTGLKIQPPLGNILLVCNSVKTCFCPSPASPKSECQNLLQLPSVRGNLHSLCRKSELLRIFLFGRCSKSSSKRFSFQLSKKRYQELVRELLSRVSYQISLSTPQKANFHFCRVFFDLFRSSSPFKQILDRPLKVTGNVKYRD